MERGLVVIRDTDRQGEVLRTAERLAGGTDAGLVVLAFATEERIGSDARKVESIGGVEGVSFDGDTAVVDAAEEELSAFVAAALGETDVEYEVTVEVLSKGYGRSTLDAADEFDCDHVFLDGRRRSPAGKAVFGDWIQRVLLNFDDFVTVSVDG